MARIGKAARYAPDASFRHERAGTAPIDLRFAGTALSLYYADDYDAATLDTVVELARAARGVLDIGAQVGLFSLLVAAANPEASVTAFEPDPVSTAVLLDNIRLNANRAEVGSVRVCQIAVSDEVTIGTFHLAGGNSSLNPSFRASTTPLLCPTTTVDRFLADVENSTPIDLVKIDTESTELSVLMGMTETVRRWRPAILIEVLRGRTEAGLNAFSLAEGYRAIWLTSPKPVLMDSIVGDASYRDLNFLLVPGERLESVMATLGLAG